MGSTRLETERLRLREIHLEDTEGIYQCWMQDEAVSRYMWWKASGDRGEAEAFVAFELGNRNNDRWNRWLVERKDTGELVGTCLLFFNEEEGHWDISYNLGRAFWGKGYMTEAMGAVLRYGVEILHLDQIATSYALENPASGRVLEKLGFRVEREIPYECGGGELTVRGNYCVYQAG